MDALRELPDDWRDECALEGCIEPVRLDPKTGKPTRYCSDRHRLAAADRAYKARKAEQRQLAENRAVMETEFARDVPPVVGETVVATIEEEFLAKPRTGLRKPFGPVVVDEPTMGLPLRDGTPIHVPADGKTHQVTVQRTKGKTKVYVDGKPDIPVRLHKSKGYLAEGTKDGKKLYRYGKTEELARARMREALDG